MVCPPPAKILTIDTATDTCSVALYCQDKTAQPQIAQRQATNQIGHSQVALQLIYELFAEQNCAKNDLDLIVVDVGPGSFTGLRIGIGIAKGLAYATKTPILGISSLETLAAQCNQGMVISCIDARMGEIYSGVFQCHKDRRPTHLGKLTVGDPLALEIPTPKIPHAPPDNIRGIGSGWDVYQKQLQQSLQQQSLGQPSGQPIEVLENRYPQAKSLLKLGLLTPKSEWSDGLNLNAAYIRNRVATPKH